MERSIDPSLVGTELSSNNGCWSGELFYFSRCGNKACANDSISFAMRISCLYYYHDLVS